jgi:hypothetical protein
MNVADWLREPRFGTLRGDIHENGVSVEVVCHLTAEDSMVGRPGAINDAWDRSAKLKA